MKMFKRSLAAAMATCMMLASAACTNVPQDPPATTPAGDASTPSGSTSTPAAGEKVKIRFMSGLWDGTRKTINDYIQKGAAEQFPNVEVEWELTGTSGDWANKLKTYNATGDMPDVFFMAGSSTFPIVKAGNVINLAQHDNGWSEKFFPAKSDAGYNDDGSFYAFSEGIDYYFNPVIFYNKKIFADAGIAIPKTWDELTAACETLKSRKLIPIAMCDKESSTFAFFLHQMLMMLENPSAVDEIISGKADWSHPVSVSAINRVSDMVKRGCFPEDITNLDYGAAMELFTTGQAAMYIQMSWDISAFADNADVGIMPWPQISPEVNPEDLTITWAAPNAGYAVYSKTKNPEVAIEFAKMCAFQAAFGAATDLAQASIMNTGVVVNSKLSELARTNLEHHEKAPIKQKPYGNYYFSSKMYAEFSKLGSQVLTGQYTGEQFAKDISEAWSTNWADREMG